MGGDWVDKLIKDTQDWTVIEAESFISFLESKEIKFDNVLAILKTTDYLHVIRANQAAIILEEETVSTPEVVNQVYQQTEDVSYQAQPGSDVFIHFAREQFRRELEEKGKFLEGEEFEDAFKRKIGKKGQWGKKITEAAGHLKWTISDAQKFLDFLKEKIGESATFRVIKTVSFFHDTTYENFQLRFDIFSKYVDREKIAEQLRKCLTCFGQGKPEVIRGVIEVVREYFEEEGESVVKEALNKTVIVFSLSENQFTKLRELLDFLEGYIGKEGVKDIILNKPVSFTKFRVKKDLNSKMYILQLPLVVEYLESYIEREAVREMRQKSFHGLAVAEIEKLRAVVRYIEKYIEEENGREMAIKEIMTSVNLFAKDSYFDESKISSFIFDQLNNLLKSIDESIQSTNYNRQKREIWKTRLQDVFLDFSIESLQGLHEDINVEKLYPN